MYFYVVSMKCWWGWGGGRQGWKCFIVLIYRLVFASPASIITIENDHLL